MLTHHWIQQVCTWMYGDISSAFLTSFVCRHTISDGIFSYFSSQCGSTVTFFTISIQVLHRPYIQAGGIIAGMQQSHSTKLVHFKSVNAALALESRWQEVLLVLWAVFREFESPEYSKAWCCSQDKGITDPVVPVRSRSEAGLLPHNLSRFFYVAVSSSAVSVIGMFWSSSPLY